MHADEWPCARRLAAFVGQQDTFASERAVSGWEECTTRDFSVTILPGEHFYLRSAPPQFLVDVIAEHILARLASQDAPKA